MIYDNLFSFYDSYYNSHYNSNNGVRRLSHPRQSKKQPGERAEEEGRGGQALGGGDDAVGSPHRAQASRFALFELKFLNSSCSSLFSLLKLDDELSIERFEPTVSQSAVPSPPLTGSRRRRAAPGTYFHLSKSDRAHLYPNLSELITFAQRLH